MNLQRTSILTLDDLLVPTRVFQQAGPRRRQSKGSRLRQLKSAKHVMQEVRTGLLAHGRQISASAGGCRRTLIFASLNRHTPLVFEAISKNSTAATTGGILNALYQTLLVNIIKCVK